MKKYGLLGKVLGHSYSPEIHGMLGGYEYLLYEKKEEELEDFLKNGDWNGLNVTIPYKKTVVRYCDELSDLAAEIKSCNTLVKRDNGTIYGDNTDAYGFIRLVEHSGIPVNGRKCLVLGSGGASVSVCAALKSMGARPVVISRSGENNYGNLDLHADAKVIVNTTPLGMYPENGRSPVDLVRFPECEGVIDIIYNPSRTALLLQAEELGIKNAGGLYMLVGQAKRSAELFTDTDIDDGEIERIMKSLESGMRNIVLIGMPGSGKTTIGDMLALSTGRRVVDSDAELVRNVGMSIPQYVSENGEEEFRRRETEAVAALGKLSGHIISTGGGCVTRPENYAHLHQNGIIIWLQRDLKDLPREGRPFSLNADLFEMYEKRRPCYERFADIIVSNDGEPEDTVRQILEALQC